MGSWVHSTLGFSGPWTVSVGSVPAPAGSMEANETASGNFWAEGTGFLYIGTTCCLLCEDFCRKGLEAASCSLHCCPWPPVLLSLGICLDGLQGWCFLGTSREPGCVLSTEARRWLTQGHAPSAVVLVLPPRGAFRRAHAPDLSTTPLQEGALPSPQHAT